MGVLCKSTIFLLNLPSKCHLRLWQQVIRKKLAIMLDIRWGALLYYGGAGPMPSGFLAKTLNLSEVGK